MHEDYSHKNDFGKMFTIYMLVCPMDNTVKYIGRTTQALERRLYQHRGHSSSLCLWMNKLTKKNLIPIIKPLQIIIADTNKKYCLAYNRECYWISVANCMGIKLLNTMNNNAHSTFSFLTKDGLKLDKTYTKEKHVELLSSRRKMLEEKRIQDNIKQKERLYNFRFNHHRSIGYKPNGIKLPIQQTMENKISKQ